MVEWLLVLQTLIGSTAVTQLGPFKSQAACVAAGEQVAKTLNGGEKWICVPTQLPAAE